MRRLGLRGRLVIALATVAVGAVMIATLLANSGLESQLDASAERRLDQIAAHMAEVGAEVYAREGSWTPAARRELTHLAAIDDLLVVVDGDRRDGALVRQVPVMVEGREVGRLVVTPEDDAAFTAPDRDLHHRLNRLHLVAGLLAGLLGVGGAFLMAGPLARPVRRMTRGARQMEQGDLETRVAPAGGRELEQLAHALNRLAATLKREETLRREATADLAHELRTPLTGILTRIEAAQDGVLDDDAANLDAMHGEALRLKQLIEDLGRLADAQQFALSRDTEWVDLDEIVLGRATAVAEEASHADVRIELDLRPVAVRGDRSRLEQVAHNLISNAIRYTDAGGAVTLRTRQDADGAVLEVTDTGIGMAPEDLPHVFERFWRSDRSRNRARGGAGIGLAIVQELVRAHEGHVEVDSWPGRGSTFRVRLPAPRSGSRSGDGTNYRPPPDTSLRQAQR